MSKIANLSTAFVKREILKLSEQMLSDAYDFDKPIDVIITEAKHRLDELKQELKRRRVEK